MNNTTINIFAIQNDVFATGRLAKDARIGKTENKSVMFAKFDLVSDKRYVKRHEENPPAPNYFPVEIYGDEKVAAYQDFLKKGQAVAVHGSIRTGSYKDANGNTKYTWYILADEIAALPEGQMTGMSTVTLIGELAKDSSLSYTKGDRQTAVLDMFVECGRQKSAGCDYIPVTHYGRLGEELGRYMISGKTVAVKGKLDTSSYKNSEGTTVYTWKVVSESFSPIGSAKRAETPEPQAQAIPAATAQPTAEPIDLEGTSFEDAGFLELPDSFDDEYIDD